MVAYKEQEMKFFISNKTETGNKFGKWHYFADSKCKVIKTNGTMYIYFGYLISGDLESKLHDDFDSLVRANGSFTVARISADRVDVIVDYFSRYKVFARQSNGLIEITNNFGLLSLTRKDLDITESAKRMAVPQEFIDRPHVTDRPAGTWTDYHTENLQGISARDHNPAISRTIFNNVYMLEPGTQLCATDHVFRIRLVDYDKEVSDAFKTKSRFDSVTQLEDYIHECMSIHTESIKKNYKNIHCTVSEGVDSVLQAMYFKDTKYKKSMYKYTPELTPHIHKQRVMDHFENVCLEDFPLQGIEEYCKSHATDPTCLDFDTLPTYGTIKNFPNPIDIMLYGAGGDDVFLHRKQTVEPQVFQMMLEEGNENILERYNNYLESKDKTYSSRRNIDTPTGYRKLQQKYTWLDWENKPDEAIEWICRRHTFPEDIRDKDLPQSLSGTWRGYLYCRQISSECDKEITSLYHDLNFSHEVMKLPLKTRLEVTMDVGIQRNIMSRHWNYNFQTPYKDQAVFNTYKAIKPYYRSSIAHVLQDNLRKLLDNEG